MLNRLSTQVITTLAAALLAVISMAASAPLVAADGEQEGGSASVQADDALPELGDSATRVLSPHQEKRIGQQFLRQLLRDRFYIDDPELNAYLNRLGAKVAQNAALRGESIQLHLLENPDLNAFAVPGGHITLHTGLILATEDESELASVAAHETAHISQRHLPRLLAKSQASQLPAAAALLASVLVGGQVGLAGFTVANAALLSNQLAYTRDFEREADAIGIKLLAQAGYDPSAMGRFFEKLDRGGDGAPEFLRTHPLSYTRTAEAENRAGHSTKTYPSARAFHFAKAKIRALHGPRSEDEVGYFTAQAANSSGDQQDAAIYGLALAQKKLRRFEQARATLAPLLAADPLEVAPQLARADIDLAAGAATAAAARHRRLLDAHPQRTYLAQYLAASLLAADDAAGAKRLIRHQLRRHKDMFTWYPLLSQSNVKLGLLAESHQANAEFYAALGEHQAAVSSLKLALRETGAEGYLHDSIAARLSEIEDLLGQGKSR